MTELVEKNGNISSLFGCEPSQLQFKEDVNKGFGVHRSGLFKPNSKDKTFVGRDDYENGFIFEGIDVNRGAEGFGRIIWEDGSYYVGELKNNVYHGYGRDVEADGRVKEGIWEDNEFKGKE